MGERTTVIGTILAVVFQNEENGYTVARIVTDDGEPVTVVGCNNHAELWDSDSWSEIFQKETTPENIAAVMEELEF